MFLVTALLLPTGFPVSYNQRVKPDVKILHEVYTNKHGDHVPVRCSLQAFKAAAYCFISSQLL